MTSTRHLVAAMVGVALLLGGSAAACQASKPDQRSTVTTQKAEMPDLPADPDAATAVVRKMLTDETILLLKASGLKYTGAQFDVPTSFDDDNAQSGDLSLSFDKCTDDDVRAMTAAIRATAGIKAGSATASTCTRARCVSKVARSTAGATLG
jgi:hypothetical protein